MHVVLAVHSTHVSRSADAGVVSQTCGAVQLAVLVHSTQVCDVVSHTKPLKQCVASVHIVLHALFVQLKFGVQFMSVCVEHAPAPLQWSASLPCVLSALHEAPGPQR